MLEGWDSQSWFWQANKAAMTEHFGVTTKDLRRTGVGRGEEGEALVRAPSALVPTSRVRAQSAESARPDRPRWTLRSARRGIPTGLAWTGQQRFQGGKQR